MYLPNLQSLALGTQSAYLLEVRQDLIDTGLLTEPLDEGVLDVVKNAGQIARKTMSGGLKAGKTEFMRNLFSGKNSKAIGDGMEASLSALVKNANAKAARLSGKNRTSDALLNMITTDLSNLIGPIGKKIFLIIQSKGGEAVSLIENPKLLQQQASDPLVKIALTFDMASPIPDGITEFFAATYSKKLDQRAYELHNKFEDSQVGRATHEPHEGVHPPEIDTAPAASGKTAKPAPAASGKTAKPAAASASTASAPTASAKPAAASAPAASGKTAPAASGSSASGSSASGSSASGSSASGSSASGSSASGSSASGSSASGSSASGSSASAPTYNQTVSTLNAQLDTMISNNWKLNATMHAKMQAKFDKLKPAPAASAPAASGKTAKPAPAASGKTAKPAPAASGKTAKPAP